MKHRKDECIVCFSRKCYERVVSQDKSYDEISCIHHIKELYEHSDKTAPGVMKRFISSTGKQKRGVDFST